MKLLSCMLAGLAALSCATSSQALVVFNADNEAFTVGSPPPLTGAPGAPSTVDPNLTLSVEDGSTVAGANLGPDHFLRLAESAGEAPDFRYDAGTSYTSGIVSLSMDLLFEGFEAYHVYFRESGSSATSVANINFRDDGLIQVQSAGGSFLSGTYLADTAYTLTAVLDLDSDLMSIWLNGTPIATNQVIDDVFGAAIIGFEFSGDTPGPNQSGRMQVDNFMMTVSDRGDVPEPSSLLLLLAAGAGFGALSRRRRTPPSR